MLFVVDLVLLALFALTLGFRTYFKNRLQELLLGGRYRELLEWLKKYRKLWPVNHGFPFWAARAAYFYGDTEFFKDAMACSLHMRRTSKAMRYVLLCCDAVLAFQSGGADAGMRKYREIRPMKPGKARKWLAGTVAGMTDLLDGIASYHAGNSSAAKAKLLETYGKFQPGISKSVCSRYLARIFSESGEENQGKELLRWARAYMAGTLYACRPEVPPEDVSLCPVHPGQKVVGTCLRCGAPVCMKCLNEHRGQICRECFQKELQIKKMTAERKDARNYLIVCTAMVAGTFLLFTVQMHSLYFSFPLFFQNIHAPYPWNVLQTAGIYTLIISGLFNGIWLFIRFIRNRSRATKIVLAVLSIITFAMIYAAGVFLLVPAYLFYLVRYFFLRRKISGQAKWEHP